MEQPFQHDSITFQCSVSLPALQMPVLQNHHEATIIVQFRDNCVCIPWVKRQTF